MIESETINPIQIEVESKKLTTGLSIVLPCYNEEEHIVKDGVQKISEIIELLKVPYEIILIDDGSQNNTRAVIDEVIEHNPDIPLRKIFNEKNIGRGGTVMIGMAHAKYDIAGYLDIDLEIGSQYIPHFFSAIKQGADMAIAERIYKVQMTPFCLTRFILSKGYIWLSTKILGIHYPDTEAGYKFFNTQKVLDITNQIHDKQWFWDTEIVARAHKSNWKIEFLPCLFLRRDDKISSVRVVKDSIDYLKAILKFKKQA